MLHLPLEANMASTCTGELVLVELGLVNYLSMQWNWMLWGSPLSQLQSLQFCLPLPQHTCLPHLTHLLHFFIILMLLAVIFYIFFMLCLGMYLRANYFIWNEMDFWSGVETSCCGMHLRVKRLEKVEFWEGAEAIREFSRFKTSDLANLRLVMISWY